MATYTRQHADTATATDDPRTPDDQRLRDTLETTDAVTVELIEVWRHHADTATATDAARRRHVLCGTGARGWEPEAVQLPWSTSLDALATDSFWVEDLLERRLLVQGVARICCPRDRRVHVRVTFYPDPYTFPEPPTVLYDDLLSGVGFTDVGLPVSPQYGRHFVQFENLEDTLVSPVQVLVSGWSAKEVKNPARYPLPGV